MTHLGSSAHAVTIESTMPCPATVVAPRVLTVLSGYVSRDDIVLTLDLGVAGAAMSVPVTVTLGGSRERTTAVVPFVLSAASHAGWFPMFRGEACSEANSPLASTLRLRGAYEAPLGTLGALADRTVLANAAERGLRSFLDRLRTDVLEEIRRSELDVRRQTAR